MDYLFLNWEAFQFQLHFQRHFAYLCTPETGRKKFTLGLHVHIFPLTQLSVCVKFMHNLKMVNSFVYDNVVFFWGGGGFLFYY